MNQYLIAILLMAFTVSLQAQDEGGLSFGIRAGVNFQNINGKDANGDKLTNDLVTRYHAGVQVDIPVAPQFYFQPGLIFTTKGSKGDVPYLEQIATRTINLSYVEIPMNFLFKPMLGNGHMLLGVGPYVGYGVGGKAKFEAAGLSNEQDINFQKDVAIDEAASGTYFRPWDVGANLLVGYQFGGGLFFQLNAQLGLTKINPNYTFITNDKTSLQNTGFGFSLGYGF